MGPAGITHFPCVLQCIVMQLSRSWVALSCKIVIGEHANECLTQYKRTRTPAATGSAT